MTISRLRWSRNGVAALVALDLLALLGSAFHRTTVTTTRTIAAASPVAPAPSSSAPTQVQPGAPAPTSEPVAALPVITSAPITLPRASDAPAPAQPAPVAPSPTTSGTSDRTAAPCPLPLSSPSTNGGLQSLIGYAPAFGPFTGEAFAAASAYAPVLTLVGPVLQQYPQAAPVIEPLITPLLEQWEKVLAAGYGVVGPFYSPYRAQFIGAETQLATAIAPFSQSLASSSAASCIIDLQYTLISRAH